MNNNYLNSNSKYKVRISFDDISSVNDILVSYYLPLIGSKAFSLYSALMIDARNTMINSLFISIDRIISMLNISPEDIEKEINKLEMVKLINLKNDGEDRIIFVLNKPLSPKEFNDDFQLKGLFTSKAGQDNIEINNKLFNSMRVNNFDIDFEDVENMVDASVNNSNNNSAINATYNFDNIKKIISAKNIDWTSFWCEEIERKILNYSIVYGISDFDIAIRIIEVIESGNEVIPSVIFNVFKLDNNNSGKTIIESGDNTKEIKLDYMRNLRPSDFIVAKLDRKPNNSEIELITKLTSENGMVDSMINILIDFSLLINDGIIVPKYISMIADTLVKQGIDSDDLLIKYLKTTYKMKNNGHSKEGSNNKIMKDVEEF